jgi:subtilisin family serine protease
MKHWASAILLAIVTACSSTPTPPGVNPEPPIAQQRATVGATRAWSGGRKAWSGGRKAWSGGLSGEPGVVLAENAAIWERLALALAHELAPRLGEGVTVAVIDTGIDHQHPAFAGRLSPQADWWDFVDDDGDPQEAPGAAYGHGTIVASIVLQVAPNATILPLRVLGGDGSGLASDVAAAIEYAAARGAEIIQLSLGTEEPSPEITAALERATAQGIYVVASAGNSNREPTYPARQAMLDTPLGQMMVGVGSVDLNDQKSWFSNFLPDELYDDPYDLVAFGEQLYGASPNAEIAYWSGTSMAAPLAAGALALAIAEGAESRHPRALALKIVEYSLDIDAEGNAGGQEFELEQRLELGIFLCGVLAPSDPACHADDDDDDDD